jgi:alpha-beta hydrolase superfamily lysophospholipase
MQSATFDHNSRYRDGRSRVTAAQRFAELTDVFRRVASTYTAIRQYPALAATDPDPDPLVRSRRWTPHFAHFCCDVEMLTEQALRDAPDLQAAWFKLAADEDGVPPKVAREVITRCGKHYKSRKIDPRSYFSISLTGGSR